MIQPTPSSPRDAQGAAAYQQCLNPACAATFSVDETHFACPICADLIDVVYDWGRLPVPGCLQELESRWGRPSEPLNFSGVWRFRDLLPFAPPEMVVTIGEGQTLLQTADKVRPYVGMNPGGLLLQYEGMNPSGSFKDNGMTAAFTHARMGRRSGWPARARGTHRRRWRSTARRRELGFRAIIFIGSGKIAYGKLAQALDHGALTIQIVGDFDDAMQRVRQVADRLGIYLMNSVNPFRLEGQKTIMFRVLEGLGWEVPDWIVVPGGNLGNSSSLRQGVYRAEAPGADRPGASAGGDQRGRGPDARRAGRRPAPELERRAARDGEIRRRTMTRLDAEGHQGVDDRVGDRDQPAGESEEVLAGSDRFCDGVVREVSDQEIMDAKARVGAGGLGCEPASAASVAGARRLREEGVIAPSDRVVCILTGHQLKDPTATVAYHSARSGPVRAGAGESRGPTGRVRESAGGGCRTISTTSSGRSPLYSESEAAGSRRTRPVEASEGRLISR